MEQASRARHDAFASLTPDVFECARCFAAWHDKAEAMRSNRTKAFDAY
jgi:hypothetical protein